MTDETNITPSNPPSNDDKNIATITHLAGTVFFFIPGLVVWAIKKDDNAYLANHAKEALNFQITVLIAMVIAKALIWILLGLALLPLVFLGNLVFCLIAAISTSKGQMYRYPLCLRLIS